jgi:predicted MPP superfamily phosphohydrolase
MKKIPSIVLIISFLLFSVANPAQSDNSSIDTEVKLQDSVFVPYKFLKISDTQQSTTGDNSGPEATIALVKTAIQENDIDFILFGGDMVEWGAEQNDYDTYFWPHWTDINNSGIPIYYAIGNHDYKGYTVAHDEVNAETWLANVNNPGNEFYFSFNSEQNDTHFIILNSEYYFEDVNTTRQQAQINWLISDLQENTIERTVVMIHRGFYGAHPGHQADKPPIVNAFEDIFVEYGIDVVLAAHDHCFFHGNRYGIDHITSGMGATTYVKPILAHPDVEAQEGDMAFEGNQISIFEATETGFNVEVIFTNGTTFEYSFITPIVDTNAPRLVTYDNTTAYEDTDGYKISWTFDDEHHGNYTLELDNTTIQNGSWISNVPISYSVDHLTAGNYIYTISLNDTKGYSTSLNTSLTVLSGTAPTTTIPTTTTTTSNPTTTTSPTPGFQIMVGLTVLSLVTVLNNRRQRKNS